MPSKDKLPPPERVGTDQSLRLERLKTDQELNKVRTPIEEDSDAVIKKARDRADQVLDAARKRADKGLEQEGTGSDPSVVLQQARAREDGALQRERDRADERLMEEREQRKLLLASLLLVERGDTDRRLLVERARADQAVTTRDEFMGMVSHDVRTMLAGISMTAAMLARGATDDEPGRRVLKAAERIQNSTVRMNRLIGDLVDVASIEAGKLAVASERNDVIPLIREAVDAFQLVASEKELSLESEIPLGPLLATFDHDRVLQVLCNLLSNAVKFTNKGGKILLGVERIKEWVRFFVRDTGMGIPAHQLEPVFERFWQVTPDDQRGLGLGLFISRCLVEAHGGKIWATSEVGAGSTFFFTLPGVASLGH